MRFNRMRIRCPQHMGKQYRYKWILPLLSGVQGKWPAMKKGVREKEQEKGGREKAKKGVRVTFPMRKVTLTPFLLVNRASF